MGVVDRYYSVSDVDVQGSAIERWRFHRRQVTRGLGAVDDVIGKKVDKLLFVLGLQKIVQRVFSNFANAASFGANTVNGPFPLRTAD